MGYPGLEPGDEIFLLGQHLLLAAVTGNFVPRNKAIVGENAFAHEAGIHQHGMLQHASTYEIMRPEDVGLSKSNLVLGKHSGRAALADRARALGFHITADQLQSVFQRFKELADKKKEMHADQEKIQAELDELVELVQSTTGHAQQAAMADLLTKLVEQRAHMGGMMQMHPEMMKGMMSEGMSDCPMMKKMHTEKHAEKAPAEGEDHSQHH